MSSPTTMRGREIERVRAAIVKLHGEELGKRRPEQAWLDALRAAARTLRKAAA